MWRRLQPYVAEAAALCGGGCSPRCRLDGEAALGDLLLCQADILEPLSGGDADLRLHEVDSRDDLGHGVLHLGGYRVARLVP